MNTRVAMLSVTALFVLLSAATAGAQDGLYAPVLPGDTALVRVINATAGEELSIDIGTRRIGPVAGGTGSAYYPVRPGVYVIFARGMREPLTAASSTFHTVLITPNRVAVIEDTHHEDPLRAQLLFYNATAGPLRLDAVAPTAAPLFDSVLPGQTGTIVINAIPITLSASRTGPNASPEDYRVSLTLARGESFAVVVRDAGPGLEGFVVAGEVASGSE